MDSFKDQQPWGLQSQDIAQLADQDDFMAFLQKLPALNGSGSIAGLPPLTGVVNPHNVSTYSSLTPPASEDSSPSPSNSNQDQFLESNDDPTLKRKASNNHLGSEPSNKTQHTASSSTEKRSALGVTQATRRKTSGQAPKDEQRLLKRKEQNRAAQRAFRERKEKHVKDLEDKLAELEARNVATQSENDNLRDMLSRLQNENTSLKQSTFTFSVQKNTPSSESNSSPRSVYSPTSSMVPSNPIAPKATNPLDWSSLTSFDPNILNILDDNVTQPTATDNAMQMGFGFGTYSALPPNLTFTTIAENRMFMTPTSIFDNLNDTPSRTSATAGIYPNNNNGTESNTTFNQFDLNALSSWPVTSSVMSNTSNPDPGFEDPLSVYLGTLTGQELAPLPGSTSSLSPITHHTTPASLAPRKSPMGLPLSSPLTGADSLFTPAESPRTDSDISTAAETSEHRSGQVPKKRSECRKAIANAGNSVFAPPLQQSDEVLGTMLKSPISKFPMTERNGQNVDVLAPFKAMADPQFRNSDISNLCDEFSQKACCDGTKHTGTASETL